MISGMDSSCRMWEKRNMNAKMRWAVLSLFMLSVAVTASGQSRLAGTLVSQQELRRQMQGERNVLLIDVRTPEEFNMGHVPGATNIPYTELAKRLSEVRPHPDNGVVLYCESGRRAGIAEGILREAGLDNIRHLAGDMAAWRKSGLPIEK